MKIDNLYTRRTFLKTSGLAALLVGCSSPTSPDKIEDTDIITDVGDYQINPYINNLRVTCCHDSNMVAGSYGATFEQQNNAIDTAKVAANLDKMAKMLVQKNNAAEAWATILRKPAAKAWNQVKCAIKVNCINTENMPRVAIVGKVCQVLVSLGVVPENIVVYDGASSANGKSKFSPYVGTTLPAGVIVSRKSDSLGGTTGVQVSGFSDTRTCTADIANGVVDILVNCAVNKGHGSPAAGVTLCLKNHFGTFNPGCSSPGSRYLIPYIVAINKSNAIIGGNPVRQQLCLVDSLWASVDGPGGPPSHATGAIVMGTFAPAVDYLTTQKMRQLDMGVTPDSKIKQFLTEFGYTEDQFSNLDFVTVPPA